MPNADTLCHDLEMIRRESPLVQNITNYVVMNSTANALLALGASPVMCHAIDEVEEMVGMARALVVNIGTLDAPWVESMRRAVRAAKAKGVPWVLDPVGAGATRLRTASALTLLDDGPPEVLRGNPSEIMALHGGASRTKGVDSTHGSLEALKAANLLALSRGCVVSVSGAVDVITNGSTVVRVANGHSLMTRVTGLGCCASAITGAFLAVDRNALDAAAHAMAVMGIAGEMAMDKAAGPGTLQLHFLDALHALGEKDVRERLRMEAA